MYCERSLNLHRFVFLWNFINKNLLSVFHFDLCTSHKHLLKFLGTPRCLMRSHWSRNYFAMGPWNNFWIGEENWALRRSSRGTPYQRFWCWNSCSNTGTFPDLKSHFQYYYFSKSLFKNIGFLHSRKTAFFRWRHLFNASAAMTHHFLSFLNHFISQTNGDVCMQ